MECTFGQGGGVARGLNMNLDFLTLGHKRLGGHKMAGLLTVTFLVSLVGSVWGQSKNPLLGNQGMIGGGQVQMFGQPIHLTSTPVFSNFSTPVETQSSAFVAFGGTQYNVQPGQLQINFPSVANGSAALMVLNNVNNVSFSGYGGTALTMTNPSSSAESISVWVVDTSNQAWRADIVLPANSTQNYAFLNSPAPSGTSVGMQALPPIFSGFVNVFSTGSSSINWSQIASIQVYSIGPQSAQTVDISNIWLLSNVSLSQLLTGCTDRWGQSTLNPCENTIAADSDLVNENTNEQKTLASGPLLTNIDAYGGSTSLPAQTATGSWQLSQVNGKWWFVDPLGHLYFMSGVDEVDPSKGATIVTNRNYLFQSLPSSTDPLAVNYGTTTVNGQQLQTYNMYTQNLQLKYQTPNWLQPWLTTTTKRLQNWGFNSYGSYSEWYENNTNTLPYLASLSLTGSYDTIPTGNNTNAAVLPDPWDPQFKSVLHSNMNLLMETMKTDSMLVGIYTGIELGWTGLGPNQNLGVAFGVMNSGPSEPAHIQLVNMLQAEYKNIRYLNLYWNTHFSSFQSVNFPLGYPGSVTPWMAQDLDQFEVQFAAQFFSTCKSVIKTYNPNLLYLGTEIGHYCPEVMQGAVGNVDAMCVNRYDVSIPTDVIGDAQTYNIPMLITEFDFSSTQSGMWAGPMVQEPDEAIRDQDAVNYMNQATTNPMVVGADWYLYYDDPLTGSLYGYPTGGNFNQGLVDQTDTPYWPLISAFQQFHLTMYSTRWNS